MIKNASSMPLSQTPSTLVNVGDALLNWLQRVTFILIQKRTVNFELIEFETPVTFQGVVEPIPSKKLQMKPEGQRHWNYQTVWATPDLVLKTDDIVKYAGIRYRVTGVTDWSKYGYVSYDLTQDFRLGAL